MGNGKLPKGEFYFIAFPKMYSILKIVAILANSDSDVFQNGN
jgi:hypothetical protein